MEQTVVATVQKQIAEYKQQLDAVTNSIRQLDANYQHQRKLATDLQQQLIGAVGALETLLTPAPEQQAAEQTAADAIAQARAATETAAVAGEVKPE